MDRESNDTAVSGTTRRKVLRVAGVAAAGSVGAAAIGAPAAASPGGELLLGGTNDAGATRTTIQGQPYESWGTVYGPALSVANPNGATLRLAPTPYDAIPRTGDLGLIAADPDGDVHCLTAWPYLDENGQEQAALWPAMLYSSRWATSTVAVRPVRVFDTRNPAQRANIVSGAGAIDSAGVVKGGATIVISLDSFVDMGTALHANLTVTKTQKGGYVTVWGSGPRPTASTVNWWTSGQTLANAVLSPLGPWGGHNSTIAVFCSAGTAILMDLTGFEVAAPWQVLTDKPGTALARPEQSSAGRLAQRAPVEPLQA